MLLTRDGTKLPARSLRRVPGSYDANRGASDHPPVVLRPQVSRQARHDRDRDPERTRRCRAHRSRSVHVPRLRSNCRCKARASRGGTSRRYCSRTSISIMPGRRAPFSPGIRTSRCSSTNGRPAPGESEQARGKRLALFRAGQHAALLGEIAPVPRERLRVLAGGERVEAGGRTFDVLYTPGHAHHHVSYFDASSGIAFVGDTAGMRVKGGTVVPPTPPPDFDVELWMRSIERIAALRPQTMFLTHFGPADDVQPHLQTLGELRWMVSIVEDSLRGDATDAERSRAFGERLRRELFRAGRFRADAGVRGHGRVGHAVVRHRHVSQKEIGCRHVNQAVRVACG